MGKRRKFPNSSDISRADRKRNRLDNPRALWEKNETVWNGQMMEVIRSVGGCEKGSL